MTDAPRVGATRVTPARTVTEADIVQFAALTRDFSRLHTDADYAARSLFGRRVGHGLLGLSIAEGLLARSAPWSGIAGAWSWEFLGPFFAGDTILAEAETTAVAPFAGSVLAIETVRVRKGGVVIQHGRHAVAVAPPQAQARWLHSLASTPFPAFEPHAVAAPGPMPASTAAPSAETGVFFEDLQDGDFFATPAMTIESYDAAAFLGLIGDLAPWLHDAASARRAGLPDRPVAPLLGLTLVEGLKYALAPDRGVGIPMASLAWSWSHRAALFPGSTVRVEATIRGRKASRSKTDRGIIAQDLTLRDQRGACAQAGQHVQMFRRRPPA